MDRVIRSFRGDFSWLSNFSNHSFRDQWRAKWRSVEHYYQAQKTKDPVWRGRIWSAPTPGDAKRLGHEAPLRKDWEAVKISVMKDALFMKFEQNPHLKERLKNTGDIFLIEGNWWHDNIWGDCECQKCRGTMGQNLLGICLMELREIL